MQKCPIYLYSNLFETIVDLDTNTRIHNIMYQHEIKIQKGLMNRVQIHFKNSDQKLLNVSTGTFIFSMFDTISQRHVLKKVIEILDDGVNRSTKGLGQVVIDEHDTRGIDLGSYKFAVTSLSADGNYSPTYSNTYYGTSGLIEVRQDAFPTLYPSIEVTDFQLVYNHEAFKYEYLSGHLDATPALVDNVALKTMAIYMTNYTGRILIQGTLDNSPGYFGNYATIQDKSYTHFTGIDYLNFNGVFSYIQTKHIPAVDPITNNNDHSSDAYHGTVDKILLRA